MQLEQSKQSLKDYINKGFMMRNYNDVTKNKASGKRQYEISAQMENGAFHMLGLYSSVSKIGAKTKAKNDYGNKYVSYQAGPAL
jgi:hypothetical protein